MEENALRNARVMLLHLPWLALLAWFSSVAWFLCDDAFISFRYARNLLEGHGLVFNPGEYVEGYSNFLWVLELAAIWGLSGVGASQWEHFHMRWAAWHALRGDAEWEDGLEVHQSFDQQRPFASRRVGASTTVLSGEARQ